MGIGVPRSPLEVSLGVPLSAVLRLPVRAIHRSLRAKLCFQQSGNILVP